MDYKRILSNKYILFRGTLICKKKIMKTCMGMIKIKFRTSGYLFGEERIMIEGFMLMVYFLSCQCIYSSALY